MQSTPILLARRPGLASLALLLAAGFLPGCSSTTVSKYDQMTAPEKAKELTRLRKKAEDQLALFHQSGGADLEALEEHVALHRETTQIFPASCPQCFANYGVSLSRLGLYYRTLADKLEEERDASPAAEKPEYDERITKYRDLMTKTFELSNQQFEVYFRGDEPIDPKAYYWVFRQCDALKDYQRALYYLDLYEANVTLKPEDKKNAAALRRLYEDAINRQEEEELERELNRDPVEPRRSTAPSRTAPAN